MMPGRTSPLPKAKAVTYFRKSQNFLRAAEAAMGDRNFDAAGLAGVHSVISACDALTVARLGIRSTAQDHQEVLRLLEATGAPNQVLTQVREVLSMKNKAEYEARELTVLEAQRVVTRAGRILVYVKVAVVSDRSLDALAGQFTSLF